MAEKEILIVNDIWRQIQDNYNPAYILLVLIRMDMEISEWQKKKERQTISLRWWEDWKTKKKKSI